MLFFAPFWGRCSKSEAGAGFIARSAHLSLTHSLTLSCIEPLSRTLHYVADLRLSGSEAVVAMGTKDDDDDDDDDDETISATTARSVSVQVLQCSVGDQL